MHLTLIVKSAAYRFLWLKAVTGFHPAHHCARCLKGTYSPLIQYSGRFSVPTGLTADGDLDLGDAPFGYLCGVTGKYADNLHLAFAPSAGESFIYDDSHIHVHLQGARHIRIPALPDETAATLPQAFSSCRNYQFGWHNFPAHRS